jgi:UDP-N-acetylmuramyl pentapeptide phosphotransferase/UDP-N-acetylglucosamine-1-phosphate transferase
VNGPPLSACLVTAAVAGVFSAVLVRLLLKLNLALDTPNHRSLHTAPTPRTGGLGVLAGTLLGAVASVGIARPEIWIALALALISFIDDRFDLPIALRLIAQLAAAGGFVWISALWIGVVPGLLMVIGLVWMTNLYNFMDGADGLAGGMAVFGFGAYAIAGALQGGGDVALISLSVASAAAGFLLFNFPPARIFMGDVGSIPLGFLAGALGLLGWRDGIWPAVFPVIVFAPFIVDATVTLIKRGLRGQAVWRAHREHYYQRVILCGWSHRRTALVEYALMGTCAAVGLFFVFAKPAVSATMIVLLGVTLVTLMAMVDRLWQLRPPMKS